MPKCQGTDCVNNSFNYKKNGVSFHRIPLKDAQRLPKWLKCCANEAEAQKSNSFLCSSHFHPSQFYFCSMKQGMVLRRDAVPGLIDEFDIQLTTTPEPTFEEHTDSIILESLDEIMLVDSSIPLGDNEIECSASNCSSRFMNPKLLDIRLFKMPSENQDLYKQWKRICDKERDGEIGYLCSLHFFPHQFKICPQSGRMFLKSDAVPMMKPLDCQLFQKDLFLADGSTLLDLEEHLEKNYFEGSEPTPMHVDSDFDTSFIGSVNDFDEANSTVSSTKQKYLKVSKTPHCDHNYSKPPRDPDQIFNQNSLLLKENRRLQSLIDELNELVKKNREEMKILKKEMESRARTWAKLTPVARSLFLNEEKNGHRSKFQRDYDKEIIDFSLCSSFYSNPGYEYLRKVFTLPTKRTLIEKLKPIECDDGFLMKQLLQLKNDITEKKYAPECIFSLDEASIKKGAKWDQGKQSYAGYTTLVEGVNDQLPRKVAGKVLVMMLKGIEEPWEKIIGYIFTAGDTTGATLAKLVRKALALVKETGAIVSGLTCDGPPVNLAMLQELGAILDPSTNTQKHYFESDDGGRKIYVFLDTPHMLKLIRNLVGEQGLYIDGFDEPVEWKYIKRLHLYQLGTGFKSGNKLGPKHVDFSRHKMKVVYAAQALSRSTAASLDFLREQNHPDFLGSAATAYFCRRVDEAFDILNSRNRLAIGQKAPITATNVAELSGKLLSFLSFMRTWKSLKGRPIMTGLRKTCVIGMAATIQSTIALANEFLFRDVKPIQYFFTYHTQQDFLEHLFSRIRQRGGTNDNPDCIQVKYIIRKLLMIKDGGIDPSVHGNCSVLSPNDDILGKNLNFLITTFCEENDEDVYKTVFDTVDSIEELHIANSIAYIAGFVLFKLKGKLNCGLCQQEQNEDGRKVTECESSVRNNVGDPLQPESSQLLLRKNRGGLVGGLAFPSETCCKLIGLCENVFERIVSSQSALPNTPNLIMVLVDNVEAIVNYDELLPMLKIHLIADDVDVDVQSHLKEVVRKIARKYLSIRCKTYVNVKNQLTEGETSKRNSLRKLIHNMNL